MTTSTPGATSPGSTAEILPQVQIINTENGSFKILFYWLSEDQATRMADRISRLKLVAKATVIPSDSKDGAHYRVKITAWRHTRLLTRLLALPAGEVCITVMEEAGLTKIQWVRETYGHHPRRTSIVDLSVLDAQQANMLYLSQHRQLVP